jgi:hypothetical protein
MAQWYDLLMLLLPFEPPYFDKVGLRNVFVGHPLTEDRIQKTEDRKKGSLLVLPGSRRGELKRHLPIFEKTFTEEVTYSWRRSSGETGVHTTFVRNGNIRTGRLIRHLPSGLLRRFRASNLSFQSAPAYDAVKAAKVLALRNKTIYVNL